MSRIIILFIHVASMQLYFIVDNVMFLCHHYCIMALIIFVWLFYICHFQWKSVGYSYHNYITFVGLYLDYICLYACDGRSVEMI